MGYSINSKKISSETQAETLIDEIKRLSIAFTNHVEADRADFTNLMGEMKITQKEFILLLIDVKVMKRLLTLGVSIAGCVGSVIVADIVYKFIKLIPSM